jgi:glycine dehydrogenase subunit 1
MVHLRSLMGRLAAVPGVENVFSGEVFHESVIRLSRAPHKVLEALASAGILGGCDLSGHYPELGNALLVCATETRTNDDILRYTDALRYALNS